jgi:hypothetical protein
MKHYDKTEYQIGNSDITQSCGMTHGQSTSCQPCVRDESIEQWISLAYEVSTYNYQKSPWRYFVRTYFHFQRKDAGVGQSVVTTQGVPQHLVNSQALVNNPAISQHVMCSQTVPLPQHILSRHALGSHLVTSQPIMSSGISVSSGLQQVPCSELLVQNDTVVLIMMWYFYFYVYFIPLCSLVWINLKFLVSRDGFMFVYFSSLCKHLWWNLYRI